MHLALLSAALMAASAATPSDLEFLRSYAQTRAWVLGRPTKVTVLPDGSAVLFLRAQARKAENRLFRFDVASGKIAELVTPEQVLGKETEQLSAEERARRERMRVTDRGFTSFEVSHDGRLVLVTLSGRAFVVPSAGGTAKQVAGPGSKGEPVFDPRLSPDGKSVAFVRGGELWVAKVEGGEAREITHGSTRLKTHAQAEFVAQEELHRFTGYWWSPDSKRLVYEEADSSGVEQLWFGDPAHPERPVEATPYPRPGKPNAKISFGIVSAEGGPTTWIEWDKKKWEYVSRVNWEENAPLTLQLLTRDQKDLLLAAVDERTGKLRELWREHDDAWVAIAHDYHFLRDGKAFLWSSESRGEWQLQLHSADGKLLRDLTALEFGYAPFSGGREAPGGLLHVDEKAGVALVLRSQDPQERHIYEVPLAGGPARAITSGPDEYRGDFARDARVWVRIASTRAGETRMDVIRGDGSIAGQLPSVAEPYPFQPRVEIAKVGPSPGFFTALVRPSDFDPQRRYPVWVQVYGGPSNAEVIPFSSRYLLDQWIADHGYLVVRIDNRGTTGRGHDFERAVSGKFADVPLEDQVAALQALARKEPALDLGRVGIFGHSFGGYMSALAVLRRPDVFRAGVASAPVVDWLNYDTAYTERYLGIPPPAGNADDYPRSSVIQYAKDLSRPLLIVHGTADDNVHFSESLLLADTLFRAGKPFDFLPLAGMTHIISDPSLQVRDWQRVFTFFEEHLRAPEPGNANGTAASNSR
ncbi:MAG: DPP IV N-terminal domain-containing protein [Myxococcales bacterium]